MFRLVKYHKANKEAIKVYDIEVTSNVEYPSGGVDSTVTYIQEVFAAIIVNTGTIKEDILAVNRVNDSNKQVLNMLYYNSKGIYYTSYDKRIYLNYDQLVKLNHYLYAVGKRVEGDKTITFNETLDRLTYNYMAKESGEL